MSGGSRGKRGNFLKKLLGARLLGLDHPPGAGESSTDTPTAASSATSVPSGVAGLNETTTPSTTTPPSSTQHLITPTEPSGGATGDAALKSNTTNQPEPASASERPISTAAGNTDSEAQSLRSRAIKNDELSSQECKTLAAIKSNPTSQPGPTSAREQPISTTAGSTGSEAQSLSEVVGSDQLFSQERKALAAFKSNPISQTGPTTAREQPISAAADSTDPEARSSWSRAIDSEELPSQERQALADTGPGVDSRETAYLGKVEQLEKIVRQGASVVEAQCIIQP